MSDFWKVVLGGGGELLGYIIDKTLEEKQDQDNEPGQEDHTEDQGKGE